MDEPGVDEALRLLAAGDRRRLVRFLRARPDSEIDIEALIDGIAHGDRPSAEARDRLATQLHHVRLPRLQDHGLVEFDADRGTVTYRSNDRVETLPDAATEDPGLTSVE